jgi:hypothetical protein
MSSGKLAILGGDPLRRRPFTRTAALEIILRAIGIRPGDEVIVPDFTFIATASAVLQVGAVPVFVDVLGDTFNIDVGGGGDYSAHPSRSSEFTGAVSPATSTRLPYWASATGWWSSTMPVRPMARSGENAAWGALSGIGAFSFQGTKNLTCGEGGFITTNDEQLFELCCGLHTIRRGRGGGVYEHFYVGWNYRLSELQGSLLKVQFELLEAQTELRQRRVERFLPRLSAVPGIRAQTLYSRVTRAAWYVVILEFEPEAFAGVGRDSLAEALQAEGIPAGAPYHYALHWNPVFRQKNFPWVPGIATLDYSRVECLSPTASAGTPFSFRSISCWVRKKMSTLWRKRSARCNEMRAN